MPEYHTENREQRSKAQHRDAANIRSFSSALALLSHSCVSISPSLSALLSLLPSVSSSAPLSFSNVPSDVLFLFSGIFSWFSLGLLVAGLGLFWRVLFCVPKFGQGTGTSLPALSSLAPVVTP